MNSDLTYADGKPIRFVEMGHMEHIETGILEIHASIPGVSHREVPVRVRIEKFSLFPRQETFLEFVFSRPARFHTPKNSWSSITTVGNCIVYRTDQTDFFQGPLQFENGVICFFCGLEHFLIIFPEKVPRPHLPIGPTLRHQIRKIIEKF